MLTHLHLTSFKSFSDETVELAPLTFLVGANASGKSNLLDALRVLHALAIGGPIEDVIAGAGSWPGIRGGLAEAAFAGEKAFRIESRWTTADSAAQPLLYSIACSVETPARITSETLTSERSGESLLPPPSVSNVSPLPFVRTLAGKGNEGHPLRPAVDVHDALLRIRFLDLVPEKMRFYSPKSADRLGTSGENLSTAVWRMCQDSTKKLDLIDWLSELCSPKVEDVEFTETDVGDVLLKLVEEGGARVSVRSLSDGTLRFLGLYVSLLTAQPGTLLVLEEPDVGLHPARIHLLCGLLESVTKSRAVQVVATTHSPVVLQSLGEEPLENVVIFGRVPDVRGTVLRRLRELPSFREVVARRGIEHLFTTQWLERAL